MPDKDRTQKVKEYARSLGARLVGVADAGRCALAPRGHRPEDFLPGARSVVVVGLPILRAYTRYAELAFFFGKTMPISV